MRRAHRFQLEEDITCPGCQQRIPMQSRICPRCELSLD